MYVYISHQILFFKNIILFCIFRPQTNQVENTGKIAAPVNISFVFPMEMTLGFSSSEIVSLWQGTVILAFVVN